MVVKIITTENSPSTLIASIEVASRYLRPPQGSCHDSCKCGHTVLHPEVEVKTDSCVSPSTLIASIEVSSRYLRPPQGSCHDSCKCGHTVLHPEVEVKTNSCVSPSTLIASIEVPSRYLRPPQGSCHESCKCGHTVLHPEVVVKTNSGVSPSSLNGYIQVLSRYLRPPHSSCHDLCKDGHGLKHDSKDKKEHPFSPKVFCNNPSSNGESGRLRFMNPQKRKQKPVLLTLQQRRQESVLMAVRRRRRKTEFLSKQQRTQKLEQMSVQQRRQGLELITAQRRRQKSESKERSTSRSKVGITDECQINKQMDFPPERIDQTSCSDVVKGSVQESLSLKISTPNDQKNNASPEHSEEPVDTAHDDHLVANPSREMYLDTFATELDVTAIQNDAIEVHLPITKEDGSTEKPHGTKFMVPSITKGPSSLKLDNREDEKSAKKRPIRPAELASKRALGMKLGNSDADVEKLDLKALRKKLRQMNSSHEGKEEHRKFGPQVGSVPERVSPRKEPQRAYRYLPKGEINSSRSGRTTSLNSQDKVGSFGKLTFRRGKVVNREPEMNTPLVRVKYRHAKSAEDTSNTSPPSSIEVVLKHRDVNDNKSGDRKGSSSNVLEETGTKLMEARKSRVKALVHAFEACHLSTTKSK